MTARCLWHLCFVGVGTDERMAYLDHTDPSVFCALFGIISYIFLRTRRRPVEDVVSCLSATRIRRKREYWLSYRASGRENSTATVSDRSTPLERSTDTHGHRCESITRLGRYVESFKRSIFSSYLPHSTSISPSGKYPFTNSVLPSPILTR